MRLVIAMAPTFLLALVLLVGASAAAQSRVAPCDTGTRRLELTAEPLEQAPELCIEAGLSTMLVFYGAELLQEGLVLEGLERFTLVDRGNTVLRLVPSDQVVPGERFRLTVRFKDGAAPARAAFWLVVRPGQAEPLVEVYRQRRTVESCQQELREKDVRLRQSQEHIARLQAEQEAPSGLTGLFATGLMGREGISARNILSSIEPSPGDALAVSDIISYRAHNRVAVALSLRPSQDERPWSALRAELVGPGRHVLRVLPPWQPQPVQGGSKGQRVVIEAEATERETRGSFTLKVWGTDANPSIVLKGVTFP